MFSSIYFKVRILDPGKNNMQRHKEFTKIYKKLT